MFAQEDGITMPKHNKCRDPQLLQALVSTPDGHHRIVHALQCMLWSIQGNFEPRRDTTKEGVRDSHEAAYDWTQDKARRHSNQNQATYIFWMAQGIFGGNGTAEGMRYE